MFKRGSLKKESAVNGFGREDMQNKKGKIWKTKKETLFKGFPFCEVSSGVEPLYTVLQTVT